MHSALLQVGCSIQTTKVASVIQEVQIIFLNENKKNNWDIWDVANSLGWNIREVSQSRNLKWIWEKRRVNYNYKELSGNKQPEVLQNQ